LFSSCSVATKAIHVCWRVFSVRMPGERHNGDLPVNPTTRRSLFHAFNPKPSGRPYGFLEDSDLSKMILVVPRASSPCREKSHIAWAEPALFAFSIGHEALAGDHNNYLVLVVVPRVAPGSAFPDHNVRGPVMGSPQHLAP